MILIFGGTTEGRRAVEVLEEAGSLYYYSTRSDGQQIELLNGIRLEGDLDVPKMISLCREHHIKLIIDAAHPFAEYLHENLLYTARHIGAPIIRYERIYPPHSDNCIWCKDYQDAMNQMEAHGIHRLLALTGVNNIGTLRPFWEKKENECWFRILNRRFSRILARKSMFPEDHLVYYEKDDTTTLLKQIQPQAILTKESGISGGFCEKVETARKAGVMVFVIERPTYPPHTPNPQNVRIDIVNGPHGLRRAVERLLPEFYPLKSGLTTGTCATAAAVAATLRMLHNETPSEVPVRLPDGETIHVSVGYADGYAYCIKEAGDDPDVTDGIEVRAMVEPAESFEIKGGEGVGRFTLPGFDYPPGEPAINKGPRQMIRDNIKEHVRVTISVPRGAEIAHRTFNPRLGIEGGISIIGVSGIVKPFSEDAFIESIRKCMEVAQASGTERVVINSGAKSERFIKVKYPDLPAQAFVQYGNYIGETLKIANELNIPKVTLGVMMGKAVKLAAGQLDTHSKKTTMDLSFVQQMLRESDIQMDISDMTLARELWERIPAHQLNGFASTVIMHCMEYCRPLLPQGELTILLIDENGKIY